MSKNKKDGVEETASAFKHGQRAGILMTAVVLVFALAGGLAGYKISDNVHESKNVESSSKIDESSTEETEKGKRQLISNPDEITEALTAVNGEIDYMLTKNVCLQVATGTEEDSYDGYLYNPNGECIQQSADNSLTVVFTKDGHSFRADTSEGTISADTSIDVVSNCRNVLKNALAFEEGYSVYYVQDTTVNDESTGAEHTLKEYIVNVKGLDACKKLYNSVSDQYAEDLIKALSDYINEFVRASDESLSDFDWTPEFEFGFIYSDDHQLGMYCNCVINGEYQSNWICDTYFETESWELSDDWYKVNWDDNSQENLESIVKILDDTLVDMYTTINGKAPDLDDSDSEDNSTDEDSSGHDTE
jgi:hypothetical protein